MLYKYPDKKISERSLKALELLRQGGKVPLSLAPVAFVITPLSTWEEELMLPPLPGSGLLTGQQRKKRCITQGRRM